MRRRPVDAAATERIGRLYDRFSDVLYRLTHGQSLPARIEDVVSASLDAIPIDPFSGKPLRFVAEDRGYVVYSFGRNLRDEGGQLPARSAFARPTPGAPKPANDLGIRISHH